MIITLPAILVLIAVILFVLAAIGVSVPRVNLMAAGLAFWAAAYLVIIAGR